MDFEKTTSSSLVRQIDDAQSKLVHGGPYKGHAARISAAMAVYRILHQNLRIVVHDFIDPDLLDAAERDRLEWDILSKQREIETEIQLLEAEWSLLWICGKGFFSGPEEVFEVARRKMRQQLQTDPTLLDRIHSDARESWKNPPAPSLGRRGRPRKSSLPPMSNLRESA